MGRDARPDRRRERGAQAGQAAALRAAVDAAKSGKTIAADLDRLDNEHAERVANLAAQVDVLTAAVDEVGNEMARLTVEHRDAWLEQLAAVEERAARDYVQAIADAQRALRDLAPARAAVGWLEEFEHGPATVGRQNQFHGRGKVMVDGDPFGPIRGPIDVADLLRVAAEGATVPEPEQPRQKAALR
jgi:hypothetical protein